jgi:hypothetical protein
MTPVDANLLAPERGSHACCSAGDVMRIAFLSLALFLAACTSQRQAPQAAGAHNASAAPATVQEAWRSGYKMVNEKGETIYCREQLKTGSHLRKDTICLTAKELELAREASQRNLEQMKRAVVPPQGT